MLYDLIYWYLIRNSTDKRDKQRWNSGHQMDVIGGQLFLTGCGKQSENHITNKKAEGKSSAFSY